MAPTSCFTGQVHRLPDAPQAYGAMITRAKAAPGQSPYADLGEQQPPWPQPTANGLDDSPGSWTAMAFDRDFHSEAARCAGIGSNNGAKLRSLSVPSRTMEASRSKLSEASHD